MLAPPRRAWHDLPMILTLDITKIESGLYEARLSEGGTEVTAPSAYDTITAALRAVAQDIPDDFAHFVEVHYSGVSSGTIGTTRLAVEAEAVAARLVELVAAVHRSEEDLAHRRQAQASAASG